MASDLDHEASLAVMFTAALETVVPRYHEMGIRLVELSEGRVVATVPMEGNGNHYGSMFAGALFGVSEVLGGALFVPSFDMATYYPTVQEFSIRFRRPATTEVRVAAELDAAAIARLKTELAAAGRASFELDAVLTDAAGEVVATTHGVYQIRPRR